MNQKRPLLENFFLTLSSNRGPGKYPQSRPLQKLAEYGSFNMFATGSTISNYRSGTLPIEIAASDCNSFRPSNFRHKSRDGWSLHTVLATIRTQIIFDVPCVSDELRHKIFRDRILNSAILIDKPDILSGNVLKTLSATVFEFMESQMHEIPWGTFQRIFDRKIPQTGKGQQN